MKWKKTQLAWFAGFFDGEGCVCLSSSRKGDKSKLDYLSITVVTTHGPTMRRIQRVYGGSYNEYVPKNPKASRQYRWIMTAALQDKILPLLLPYCYLKRKQIRLAIEFRETTHIHRKGRGSPLSSEVWQQRRRIKEQLTKLNCKGGVDREFNKYDKERRPACQRKRKRKK